MKKFILFFSLIMGILICKAQNLPLSENFNNGEPTGWDFKASKVGTYNRNINNVCTADKGVLTNPSVGSNGNNFTGFKTGILRYINTGSIVVVRFNGYVYRGSQFSCQDQLFATTPCTAFGKVTLVSVVNNEVYGSSESVRINFAAGVTTIAAPVNVVLNAATEFKVLLDISYLDCAVNGSKRFVIDNVFISTTSGGPLPVNFKYFSAVRTGQNALLRWETATEQNNNGFFVQRNTGTGWNNIAQVASKSPDGNSNVPLNYTFTDANIAKGISQYRLVQVDLAGQQKISEVRYIRGEETIKTVVLPNPSYDGRVNILFNDQKASHAVFVVDLTGRIIKQWSNVTNNNLQVNNLMPGFYTIKIYNNLTGEQSVEKIIVN